jgi:putative ABC transport system substrate-binding protein
MRRIGVLLVAWSPSDPVAKAFQEGLRAAGYVEGRDITIEWRSANGDYDQVPRLAADLVSRNVDVIVGETSVAIKALQRATSTIPIVMTLVADPVGSGLVASLARPGGNVTGLSLMFTEIGTKRLQLLKEAVPRATRLAVLWNPETPPYRATTVEDIKSAAPVLSFEPRIVEARGPDDFDRAFSAIGRERAQVLYVVGDPVFFAHRARLLGLVSKARLPAIYSGRGFPDHGGLMSYGPNLADISRRAAVYVDKILRGAKPGDLPVEQPTQFEFVVNLRTAKALGLTIPQSVLDQADEVIR